jgi:ubiquinone/menaquinone biosynthesis C-methylase UbiE
MFTVSANFTGPRYYDELLGPLWFEYYAADLARRLPQQPGDILEIACGTGIVTRRLRERAHLLARLVATDVSKAMLDYARQKIPVSGIDWREANALDLPFPNGEFSTVVCGFGLMFMPDRERALREARRMLQAGGILLFNVWDSIDANPHALANALVLEAMFPGDSEMNFRMPYDMGDATALRDMLVRAQFRVTFIETKYLPVTGADPRRIAEGQVRGTPRATLIEQRGISLDTAIDAVAAELVRIGGDPYNGQAQAVIVEAAAI